MTKFQMYKLNTSGSVSTDVQVAVMSPPLVMTSDEVGDVKAIPWAKPAKAAKANVRRIAGISEYCFGGRGERFPGGVQE